MPALSHQLASRAASNANLSGADFPIYPAAVLLAISSFLIMLLIMPPMLWHFRNRNIGATALVAWSAILLFFIFINAIIWPNDDIHSWYNGVGLCDIEVKVQVAGEVARPAALACILRALAAVLDTDQATLIKSKAQRRRNAIIDLSCCIFFPLLQMLFHYIVQTRRYYLYGISGCVPAVGDSIVTLFLLGMPPLIWIVIDSYFAVLILIRLYRYRLTFRTILANSETNKSRFMRLYIICIVWIVCYIPVECYTLYLNFNGQHDSYSWSSTHDPENWAVIIMVPSGGKAMFARWLWLSCGFVVFVFFGFGRDAVNMYRTALLAIGLGRMFPSLKQDYRGTITATLNSYSSKARMIFKRKSSTSDSSWQSKSAGDFYTASLLEPVSPKTTTFKNSSDAMHDLGATKAQGDSNGSKTLLSRLATTLQFKKARDSNNPVLPLGNLTGERQTIQSAVTSGPSSPTLTEHSRSISADEMLMRKEVRQGSEHGLPQESKPMELPRG